MGRLGEIFRAHGEEYRARFASRMSLDQLRAMRAIETCHTAAAGEALWRCPRRGKRHFTFVGCGNRHCPACGSTRAEQWLRKHCALLLPATAYHLVTFTVPDGLRRAIRSHPRELLELLMAISLGRPMPKPRPAPDPLRPPCPNCQTPMYFEARSPCTGLFASPTRTRGPP